MTMRLQDALITFFVSIVTGGGCTSIQTTEPTTGLPRVFGWGSATNIPVTKGTVCLVRSSGISLRLHSYAPGLTLGWHETTLFIPETSKPQPSLRRPVAIRTKNYGIGVIPYCLMIGANSVFGVYQPLPGDYFVQTIQFTPNCLSNTIITKEQK